MVKPNFNFEKRQKELARKKKKEQKRLLKQAARNPAPAEPSHDPTDGSLAEGERPEAIGTSPRVPEEASDA